MKLRDSSQELNKSSIKPSSNLEAKVSGPKFGSRHSLLAWHLLHFL